jgi:hypothetical protein
MLVHNVERIMAHSTRDWSTSLSLFFRKNTYRPDCLAIEEATLRERLAELLATGLDELMVHPLPLTNERKEREQLLQVLAEL